MSTLTTKHELTECDREPIHHIAAIQGFGGLFALTGDWVIAHRSTNCAEILGLEELPDVGDPVSEYLAPFALVAFKDALSRMSEDVTVERIFGLRLTHGGDLFDCAIHRSDRKVVIEFEPHAQDEYADHLALIGPVLSQLEPVRDLSALCKKAAKLVRNMLGYDRVMIYRFHRDESGEVIAEERREDLEPYLGLRYPRADIPQQARELFCRNRFRIIADMDAEPVPIEPARSMNDQPLDLSMSVLRSHSLMHVKYMRNMGVQASLAIAIVRHGRLWGLISCHHNTPKLPPYSLRTVAEMFSQMFSLMLDRILMDRSEQLRTRGQHLHDQLMLRLAGGTSLSESLPMLDEILQEVIPHDGASVFIEGKYRSRGEAPGEDEFTAISPALGSAPISTIIASSQLSEQIPAAGKFAEVAAGAIVLPISRSPRDYLVLWRKPLIQKVKWAGDPEKAIVPAGERLQPRSSFAAWEQAIEGRCEEWTEDELQIAEGIRVTLLEVILRMTDETARERARAQEQQELLIAELNHRVRNILNLIRSLVSQSQDEAMSVAEFTKIIGGRISALASAHDNITRENWSPAPLSNLFETEIGAYLNEKKERFQIDGQDVLIRPEAYTVLALVVHELVTNSAKYGSLCDRSGSLSVNLSTNQFGDLSIKWRERGGPPVKPPTRRGFGSTIIERSIPYELKGDAILRFKLTGLEADFTIPQRFIEILPTLESSSGADNGAGDSEYITVEFDGAMLPEHVLVVEDSMIIALDTEENLKRLGVKSVSVESSVEGALSSIGDRLPDFAIIDFNLGSESSEPVAKELERLGVRFVLATGYAEMADQIEQLGASALLRKPYGRSEIEELLSAGTVQ
ncbi:HWE histidine kinase domain-containing protein [Erythrobacter sp. THAF29]|uniref:HWE histidine kinase domain-containing protein n=1 Tax=Erythrobacter sp. THAF29 TaxID=2587851 RepID=UPI0012687413|nr:HWE histidine kinase domain-containing protein [Erythrobacter sp. THAF29]QFT76767.1 Bacteriophytochrome [Erythrobacter sp. THAF29]